MRRHEIDCLDMHGPDTLRRVGCIIGFGVGGYFGFLRVMTPDDDLHDKTNNE
jgi:hypothetical protein